jgi:hypothetical protein
MVSYGKYGIQSSSLPYLFSFDSLTFTHYLDYPQILGRLDCPEAGNSRAIKAKIVPHSSGIELY